MPTRYSGVGERAKPWQAKVQLAGETYWLGVYRTREEAVMKEHDFKWALEQITREAHQLWRDKANFLSAVATVRENAATRT